MNFFTIKIIFVEIIIYFKLNSQIYKSQQKILTYVTFIVNMKSTLLFSIKIFIFVPDIF